MYPFHISPDANNNTRLVLDNISIVSDGYYIKEGKHYFKNPTSAIAYFTIKNEIYSLSNHMALYATAEEFFDAMKYQKGFFNYSQQSKPRNSENMPNNFGASA